MIWLAFAAVAQSLTSVQKTINQLKATLAPDKRTAIWDVTAVRQKGAVVLSGKVGTQAMSEALDEALNGKNVRNNLVVV